MFGTTPSEQVIDLAPGEAPQFDKNLQASLAKTITQNYKKNIICTSCNKPDTIIGNGLSNQTYRLKCSAKNCGTTYSVKTYVELLHSYFKTLNTPGIPILSLKHDHNPYKFKFLKEKQPEIPFAGSDIDERSDLQTLSEGESMDIDEHIELGKRKLQDTSITLDSSKDITAQLSQMDAPQLRKLVKHFHDKAQAAEAKYDSLQAEVAQQRHKTEEQEERLRRLEELTQNFPNVNNQASRPLISNTRPLAPAPTFAEIALRNVPEDRHAEVLNARNALKARRQENIPTTHPKTVSEQTHELRMVYVDGIQRMRFRELKGHLKSLGFSLSKIRSISFIGRTTEFIVEQDYADSFQYQVRTRLDATILPDFDTTAKASPSSTVDPKKACARRLKFISEREGTPYAIKKLIQDYIQEKNLQDDYESVGINDDAAPAVGQVPTTEATAPGLDADADAATHQ